MVLGHLVIHTEEKATPIPHTTQNSQFQGIKDKYEKQNYKTLRTVLRNCLYSHKGVLKQYKFK